MGWTLSRRTEHVHVRILADLPVNHVTKSQIDYRTEAPSQTLGPALAGRKNNLPSELSNRM